MQFPLTFWDISIWIAVIAMILLATSEILPSHHGETGIVIKENRLRMVALLFAILSIMIVLIQGYQLIAIP